MLRLVTSAAPAPAPPTPAQQQILDYVNAVATVSSYAYALNKTELPVLAFPPAWYAGFTLKFALAKAHCLSWMQGTLPTLQQLPASLRSFNALLQQNLATLLTNLQALQTAPNDADARQAVVAVLQSLLTEAQAAQGVVQELESSMDDFATQLGQDIAGLRAAANDAATAATADSDQVTKLNTVIANFEQTIALEQQRATLENLLKGDLALFIVGVAMIIGWVGGPVVDGLLAMAAIGTLAGIGDKLASEPNIQAFQAEIKAIQQEIGAVNTEVALLQNTAARFNQLLTANTAAQQALAVVKASWAQPATELAQMIQDFNDISADLNANTLVQAGQAAQDAAAEWNEIAAFANSLQSVQYNFDPVVHLVQPATTGS